MCNTCAPSSSIETSKAGTSSSSQSSNTDRGSEAEDKDASSHPSEDQELALIVEEDDGIPLWLTYILFVGHEADKD